MSFNQGNDYVLLCPMMAYSLRQHGNIYYTLGDESGDVWRTKTVATYSLFFLSLFVSIYQFPHASVKIYPLIFPHMTLPNPANLLFPPYGLANPPVPSL